MSTDTTGESRALARRSPSIAPTHAGKPGAVQNLLLATAGSEPATAAVRAAAELARVHGASVRVVSFFEPPIPYPHAPTSEPATPVAPSERLAADHQLAAVRRQLADTAGECDGWSVSIEAGHPARCISRAAEADIDLVVLGIGRKVPAERPHGDRTAIGVAMTTGTPLLAVSHDFTGMPSTVLVAVGLDATAVEAARLARAIFPRMRDVHLVHVQPTATGRYGRARVAAQAAAPEGERDGAHARVIVSRDVKAQLARVREALHPTAGTRVRTHVVEGTPTQALLELARRLHVDLVVAGVRGLTIQERSFSRNIGLHLLHEAECSVLLVPERAS